MPKAPPQKGGLPLHGEAALGLDGAAIGEEGDDLRVALGARVAEGRDTSGASSVASTIVSGGRGRKLQIRGRF